MADQVLIRRGGHQELDTLDASDIPALAYDASGAAASAESAAIAAAASDATTKANAAAAASQPVDSDLTAIAALTTTSFGRSVLTAADQAALRALIGVSAMSQIAISQTPTVSTTPAYIAGDALGGLLTFANAALANGGSGVIADVTVMCKTPALVPAIDLYLFNQTFTPTTDNSPFAPSDGDMANCIGVIPIAAWAGETASSVNSIATRFGLGFGYTLVGTSLFGQMVTRTGFTAAGTTDFQIAVQVARD